MVRKKTQQQPTAQQQNSARGRNRNQLVTYFIIFVCGFVAGIAFSVYRTGSSGQSTPVAANSQSEHNETHQAVINLEAEVTANPTNFQAWTRLGNLYFDTNQPQKAIEAYNKSLELHTGDANILTDLGVMYRRTQQPDKAIDAFDRAIAADPTHQQSRFNKGIVLFYDKGDKEGALAVWEELLKIDPQAKTSSGESIRDFINSVKADLAAGK